MATGTIKRHDTEPSPRLVITASGGGAYDLTNHSAKMIMRYETALHTAVDNSQLTCRLPAEVVDVVEVGDVFLIEHERLVVGGTLPVQPLITAYAEFTVTRGATKAATAGVVVSSHDVAGTGGNQYRLSVDAEFDLSVNSGTPATVTVLATDTTTNTSMANLVADVQSAVTLAGVSVTVSAYNDKLVFTSSSTGPTSNVSISSVDTIAADELGLVACYGVGAASDVTVAAGHPEATAVNILKIERAAIVEYPATDGKVTFEWIAGDTDKLGTFDLEFELITPQGKKFTAPNNNSFDVEVISDFDDL